LAQGFDSAAVDAPIRVAAARGRTDRNNAGGRVEKQFQIIDKAKDSTFRLGMQIPLGYFDNFCAGKAGDRMLGGLPAPLPSRL
jgi:hypothetical protein